jgi:hypothetical protein
LSQAKANFRGRTGYFSDDEEVMEPGTEKENIAMEDSEMTSPKRKGEGSEKEGSPKKPRYRF